MKKSAIALASLVAACAAPLKAVTYDEPVAVTSQARVAVALQSGPNPRQQFNVEDQRAFVASFRGELERLKLVREAVDVSTAQRADFGIRLIFAQTFHNPNGQQYILDVVMEIIGGDQPLLRQYRVISSDGGSFWKRMNTNAPEGKARAAARLMNLLIPEVAAYLEQNRL